MYKLNARDLQLLSPPFLMTSTTKQMRSNEQGVLEIKKKQEVGRLELLVWVHVQFRQQQTPRRLIECQTCEQPGWNGVCLA